MNCNRVRRYLPLYYGGELPPKQNDAVRAHLEACAGCRREHRAYVRSLKAVREWLSDDTVNWEEAEWKRKIRIATTGKEKSLSGFAPWPFKKGWAFVMMAAFVVVFIFCITRPSFVNVRDFLDQTVSSKRQTQHDRVALNQSPQDVVSMTMVSKETGLKIVWVLNKNFNLEEYE
jgi:anti-sigma factor RsiW